MVKCENCQFLVHSTLYDRECCLHEKNTRIINNYPLRNIVEYISSPEEMNRKNDCKWYEEISKYSYNVINTWW